jgi:hypothetical protein
MIPPLIIPLNFYPYNGTEELKKGIREWPDPQKPVQFLC